MKIRSMLLACALFLPLPTYAASFSGVVSSGSDWMGYDPYDPTSPPPTDLTGLPVDISYSVDTFGGVAIADGRTTSFGSSPIDSAGLSEPDFTNAGYYANDLYFNASHELIGFYTQFFWSGDDSSALVTISDKNALNGWVITVNPDGSFSGALGPGAIAPIGGVFDEYNGQISANFSITSFSIDVAALVHGSPAPEPSAWAYLIIGFFVLGYLNSRGRNCVVS